MSRFVERGPELFMTEKPSGWSDRCVWMRHPLSFVGAQLHGVAKPRSGSGGGSRGGGHTSRRCHSLHGHVG